MSMDIYYFSGTGNSLHAARELAKRLPDSRLVPIVRELRGGNIKTSAETFGIVFPNFCLSIPIPVQEFLTRGDISSTGYMFAVCTRGGSPSQAFDFIDELLKKQGKRLNAAINITMPWNHPTGAENLTGRNTPDKSALLEDLLQHKLDEFSRAIRCGDDYRSLDTDFDPEFAASMRLFNTLFPKQINYMLHDYFYQKLVRFYIDKTCSGCGLCEALCLSGRIEMVDGRPHWNLEKRCYACFACISFCPKRSIQVLSRFPVNSATPVNGRYHHPEVTWKDIAAQRGDDEFLETGNLK